MAITYEILTFPTLPVQGQLFRAPGQAYEAGFTSGGANVSSPEPGGRAFLDMQLALQTREWENPAVSWLMSKLNGDIFRVQLTKTPQLLRNEDFAPPGYNGKGVPWEAININSSPTKWNNNKLWADDGLVLPTVSNALEGSTFVTVDVTGYSEVLKRGHVIGFGNYSYMIDAIDYSGNAATIKIKPPLRNDIAEGNYLLTRPYFLGRVTNGQEFAANYEAINNGHIKPPRLVFSEVIINV